MTWVVTDYNATPGTNEVSVTKGQQVEIIETSCSGAPDCCLVRLNLHSGSAADGSGTIEGIVPMSVLKLTPFSKGSHRKGVDTSSENKESAENNGKLLIIIPEEIDFLQIPIEKSFMTWFYSFVSWIFFSNNNYIRSRENIYIIHSASYFTLNW